MIITSQSQGKTKRKSDLHCKQWNIGNKNKTTLKKNPLETIRDKLGMSLSKQLQLSKAAAGFVLKIKV